MAYEFRKDIEAVRIPSEQILKFEDGEEIELELSHRYNLRPGQRITCKCFQKEHVAEVIESSFHGHDHFAFTIKKV